MASFILRPLSVGELLDAALRLAKQLLPSLVTLQLLSAAVPMTIGLYLAAQGATGAAAYTMRPFLTIGSTLASLVCTYLAAGAASLVISEAYLGRSLTATQALRRAVGRIGPMLVASMISGVILLVCFLPAGIAFFVAIQQGTSNGGTGGATVGLAILFALVSLALPAYVLAGFSLQTVCAVLENETDGIGAARRTWSLTSGYRRRIFMLGLALFAIFGVIFTGILTVLSFTGVTNGAIATRILPVVVQFVTGAVVFPVVYSVLTLQYYDLRVRKEGFDLEMLAAALPGSEPVA